MNNDVFPVLDPHGVLQLPPDQRKQMRQSTVGTADTCQLRLKHGLEHPDHYGSSEARVRGTAYHGGMEALYLGAGTAEVLTAVTTAFEAELLRGEPDPWDTSPEECVQDARGLVLEYMQEGHRWPVEYMVLGVEQEFFLPFLPGWCFKGSIDLILLGPDGIHYLVDHKTANKKWKKGKHTARATNQPALYVWAWRQLWAATHDGEVPQVRFVFDVMTVDGDFERRDAHVTEAEIQNIVAKTADVCRLVDADGPFLPNTSSFLCDHRWCDWWAICPYGETFSSHIESPVLIGAN